MSQHTNPVSYRQRGTGRGTASTFVRAGQKDHYNWNDPADVAEYQTVVNYNRR